MVAAKIFDPLIANEVIPKEVLKPLLMGDQLPPLFVDKYIPPPYENNPRKIFEPLIAIARTTGEFALLIGRPLLTAIQLDPLFVDKNIPLFVPAKIFEPLIAKQFTVPPKGPLVCVHCAFNVKQDMQNNNINDNFIFISIWVKRLKQDYKICIRIVLSLSQEGRGNRRNKSHSFITAIFLLILSLPEVRTQ